MNLELFYGIAIQGIVVFIEFMYVIYAFLLIRQNSLLNASFHTPYKGFFTLIVWIHFMVALGVFALSILLF